MEGYVIAILVVAAPLMLLPVALVWYMNIAGTVAWIKERARARGGAFRHTVHVKA